ncbi:Heme/hemopexin-binding protein precursor [compost metagenome]
MIRLDSRSLRRRLLVGASLGSLIVAGAAEAQNRGGFGSRGGAGANPTAAVTQAIQAEVGRATQASSASQRAIASFARAAATRQAMTDAQAAARAAALAAQSQIPNGLGQGGLQVAEGVTLDPSLWVGANGPTQTTGADGRTTVTIGQTEQKAILTWDSFNVGRETDLVFNQQGNSDWVALNRVTDASADPTKILGSIKADGSVYIINRNGIIFGGASQVNVRNLIAATADISNIQFLERGITSNSVPPVNFWEAPILVPVFTDAGGAVTVEAGAQINTAKPATVVEGGGFVALLGKEVTNAGTIVTGRGQTLMAAGDDFIMRPGYGTNANQVSTTRGYEVAVTLDAGSAAGRVVNQGLIQAAEGDITLAGRHVVQDGVAIATTSVNTRGTIHLLTDLSDGQSSVTLTGDSLTLILPELDSDATATNAQRDALLAQSALTSGAPATWLNNQAINRLTYGTPDRKDMSRVEIATGGSAIFQSDSQTIAQGGQISVVAMKRTTVEDRAELNVSGVRDVAMDMASNNLKVNIQPFELRDSPLNREGEGLKNNDVWIDIRDLILLPSGTGGHEGDRYYTPGGLIEVGGHLGNTAHGIGEWAAQGGTININSNEIVAHKGAVFDISGGSLDYAAGYIQSTRMMGSDGKLYDLGQAPAGVKMLSVGNAFVVNHDRWGEAFQEVYAQPLFNSARSVRWEAGYTVGRDAGILSLSAPTVLFDGQIVADVVVGDRQTGARPTTPPTIKDGMISGDFPNRLDGYDLPQNVTPLAGGFYVGNRLHQSYQPVLSQEIPFNNTVVVGEGGGSVGVTTGAALTPDLTNTVVLSAEALSEAGLGGLRINGGEVRIEGDLTLSHGGELAVRGQTIAVDADITARSGSISLAAVPPCGAGCAEVTDLKVGEGVTLDASGLWVNVKTGGDVRDLAHLEGGAVMLESRQGDLTLGKDSLIDVSAGAAILLDGKTVGAKGGSVGLAVGYEPRANMGQMTLDGAIRAYGTGENAGGTLTVSAAGRPITIGGAVMNGGDELAAGEAAPMDLQLVEQVVLKTGEALPFDYAYTIDRVEAGQPLPADANLDFAAITLTSDWTVPDGFEAYDANWTPYYAGDVIPAGTYLEFGYGAAPAGFVVTPDIWPNGVSIPPLAFTYAKGDILQADLILPVGRTIAAGTVFGSAIKVAKPLNLDADLFQTGFSRYDIRAGGDLQVRGDVDVSAPVRRFTADSAGFASGAALQDALELWTPDMLREDAANGRFVQRQGASLSLTAHGLSDRNWMTGYGASVTDPRPIGELVLVEGASIRVDDGQSVNLTAMEGMRIDGRIEARGGKVSLIAGREENERLDFQPSYVVYDPTTALWLGEKSVIDVSGRGVSAVGADGLRYGHVSRGGEISVGGQRAAYVVVRPGAVLDASGAATEIDYLTSGLTKDRQSLTVATDGGAIRFQSQYGVFLDGDMRAHAGGAGASGGLLSIKLTTPYLMQLGAGTRDMPDYMRRLRSIILGAEQDSGLSADLQYGDCITGCWTPGQLNADSAAANEGIADLVGQARIGVDQITSGGFGSLTLDSTDVVLLDGPVNLNLTRNLTLSGTIGSLGDSADQDSSLSAAYVRFVSAGTMRGNNLVRWEDGTQALFKIPDMGDGVLTIKGGLVDMGGAQFGVNGSVGLSGGRQHEYEYAAHGQINIISGSDIRMTGGEVNAMSNIALTAAQIYPITGAAASIYAGKYTYRIPGNTIGYQSLVPGGTVSFHKLEGVTPSAPLSLYGSLTVGADIINQGGVLRAPLGSITLGVGGDKFVPGPDQLEPGQTWWEQTSVTTREVNLLPGSLTSVSARDLVIPYGGTTDGLKWLLNGVELKSTDAKQGVMVLGSLRADEGSVLDLSGGGIPAGAGFIPGRGGSVDVLKTALANVSPAFDGLSHADNKVYAIVPSYGASVAPNAIDGHAQPGLGQQIVIPAGIEGLAAGVYTLLPAEYALMEGAFRVELGRNVPAGANGVTRLADGSSHLGVTTGVANTDARSALKVEAILTPAKVVRTYSQYNETSFGEFLVKAPASALFDSPLPFLPEDGKTFILALAPDADKDRPAFSFKGKGLFDAAEGGIGGSLAVVGGDYYDSDKYTLEILADGATKSGDGYLSLYASDLNAVGARIMTLGGVAHRVFTTSQSTEIQVMPGGAWPNQSNLSSRGFGGIAVREGAVLQGPQVLLVADRNADILVEHGARITTLGKGDPAFDSTMGYTLRANNVNLLAVSNGLLEFTSNASAGATGVITVEDGASLYSDGTLSFVTPGAVSLGENVNYGARYLAFSSGSVNIGTSEALASAGANGVLPSGIALNQSVLDRLMAGDQSAGAPKLERLILSASQSVNFYGSISLDTRDAVTGVSALQLVLNTPALYGAGAAGDVAQITTGTLVWNGVLGAQGPSYSSTIVPGQPGAPIAGGAGTGLGALNLIADRIVLGYQDGVAITAPVPMNRLALGFSTVNLTASQRIESNHKGELAVYQSQAVYGQPGQGGVLNLTTPLLTGQAGSSLHYKAGGAINLTAPATASTVEAPKPQLGAEIRMTAASITADTTIALPSGRLVLTATEGDIVLGENARLDMAGKATDFFEETRYSWGGDVELESAQGNVIASSGSKIDLSADHNHAGTLKVTALNGAATLNGAIEAHARNGDKTPDASLRNGSIDIRANVVSDFRELNERLTQTGVTESRSFVIKSGDLVVGDEVKARQVTIAADGGDLIVNGRIDASGARPGSIRLSARDDLTLASTAVLDASADSIVVDGYGAPIEASNRAHIELGSKAGTLTLASGATLDLSSPDGVKRGRVELNAPRLGANDIAIEAGGALTIKGADSLSVNGFRTYQPAGGVINQALMDDVHADSTAFINAAIANQALLGRLAGLRAYQDAFHLRPGVELTSAPGQSLSVSGDLNLAGYRYASLNADTQMTGVYGSGEAGVLLVRAADDLNIYGSITDGFGEPARTPDDNGWVLYNTADAGGFFALPADHQLMSPVQLSAGAAFPAGVSLTFDAPVQDFSVIGNQVIEADVRLTQTAVLPQDWVATSAIRLPDGSVIERGTILKAGTTLPAYAELGRGALLPMAVSLKAMTWPKGVALPAILTLSSTTQLKAGDVIPRASTVMVSGAGGLHNTRPIQADGTQGRIWAVAPMLAAGSQSWSMRLVAGADIGSADGRTLRAATDLARAGHSGDLILSDRHYVNPQAALTDGFNPNWLEGMKLMQNFSVIRTGVGSLDLLAGGDYRQMSLYGVYTAGTPSAEIGGLTLDGHNVFNQPRATLTASAGLANPWIGPNFDGYADAIRDYQAWYPEHGGDLLLAVQGDMSGYSTDRDLAYQRVGSGRIGNWLWRQGGYGVSESGVSVALGQDVPTAWWINFGGYVPNNSGALNDFVGFNGPLLEGFMGIGALGGGNLTVRAGGDAGVTQDWGRGLDGASDTSRVRISSSGLHFAVGGTGRVTSVTRTAGIVTDGSVVQTGGGDIDIRLGGILNPGAASNMPSDLAGSVTNLRGQVSILSGGVGAGAYSSAVDVLDPRLPDPLRTAFHLPSGGITLVIGDADVRIDTRGDLILAGVGDPGSTQTSMAGVSVGYVNAAGQFLRPDGLVMQTSFSLWRDDTSISLFSAGGDVTPITAASGNAGVRDGRYWYPPILRVTAAEGSIRWSADRCDDNCNGGIPPLELAPSSLGFVEYLAGTSILGGGSRDPDAGGSYAAGRPVALSGMAHTLDLLPNPFRPVWTTDWRDTQGAPVNVAQPIKGNATTVGGLLAFQTDTATGTLREGRQNPALFYAADGDISNLNFGFITYDGLSQLYVNSGSVDLRASRDIVNLGTGTAIGCLNSGPIECRGTPVYLFGVFNQGGLVVHNDPSDISLISAGRDIIYGNMTVAGPGNLVVEAGRNIYQAGNGRFTSVGPLFDLSPSTRNGGAGISILTGVGAGGPNYDAFTRLYLDPANLAEAGRPLADQAGKVVKTYDAELIQWLEDRFGYEAADAKDALTYFNGLDRQQRAVFARLVYFDELKAGGREYNDPNGPRFGSYLRGRNAIATLLPEKDANGQAISYAGDLTMFGGSAVRTLFGGNIEMLVAGGQTVVGVGGVAPPSTAGVLSMGSGDIDVYSLGSVLLGQSRVFTTFGGDLLMWSAEGDINAGRGSKSTAVYQPPRRVYDGYGKVTLSPPTQNAGAGIATLNPIPEIPAGDVDLIAPLGTIDAGEAGIRVSGDVNLAALQVVNAANIQVKGDAVGIPAVAAVNTGALTAASSASSSVVAEAARLAERARPKTGDIPAIITSRFLGFGE